MSNASKKMYYLLRHNHEDLVMDTEGYVETTDLLIKLNIKMKELIKIVKDDDKGRFSFNSDFSKIRANQGHSLNSVDLKLEPQTPPAYLYHGTAPAFLDSILRDGIKKRTRNHVHLSSDVDTAYNVGKRHSKNLAPIMLQINCKKMIHSGFLFYLSDNNVWLCDHIPPEYIKQIHHYIHE